MLRQRRQRLRKMYVEQFNPEFQVAPMVDLLLVLVIFFMSITSAEMYHNKEESRLPVAANGFDPVAKGNQVIINLGWMAGLHNGTIWFENQIITQPDLLVPLLVNELRVHTDTRVLIRADKEVEYELICAVMKSCREARIPRVTFSVLHPTYAR